MQSTLAQILSAYEVAFVLWFVVSFVRFVARRSAPIAPIVVPSAPIATEEPEVRVSRQQVEEAIAFLSALPPKGQVVRSSEPVQIRVRRRARVA